MHRVRTALVAAGLVAIAAGAAPPARAGVSAELLAAAQAGDPAAQLHLGVVHYRAGEYAEAARWMREAAEQGQPEAQHDLATLYAQGRGVPQDLEQAVAWYERAVANGHAASEAPLAQARAALERLRAAASAPPESTPASAAAYRRAAEAGDAAAQTELGFLYLRGAGVPRDEARGVRWLRRAAEQGEVEAQAALGSLYAEGGHGVERDRAEAARWLGAAAEAGDAGAQANLGTMLMYGQGVARDVPTGLMWLELARRQSAEARNVLFRLEKDLSDADRAEGLRKAEAWRRLHSEPQKSSSTSTSQSSSPGLPESRQGAPQ